MNAQLGEGWEAFSAGSAPVGFVHPDALKVLSEIGISHHGESKSVDQFRSDVFDLVVTVCDDAAENCPVWLGSGKKVYMGFPDPAKAQGTDEEILAVFRKVRDDMREKVTILLNAHEG